MSPSSGYDPVVATWWDRSFHELSLPQRAQRMAEMDPEFAALPSRKQNDLLLKAYQKYYVQRMPPPTPASIALQESGISEEVQAPSAPQIPMREESIAEALRPRAGVVPGARRPMSGTAAPPIAGPVPVPAAPASPPAAAGPGPASVQYGSVPILEEEPPPRVVAAPIFARKSGRVATRPEEFGMLGLGYKPARLEMLPNPYEMAQPGIKPPEVPMKEAPSVFQVPPMLNVDPVYGPQFEEPSVASSAYMRGLAGATAGTAGGLTQAVGAITGSDTLREAGSGMSAASEDVARAFAPPADIQADPLDNPDVLLNPDWWMDAIGQGLGSVLPSMGAGLGIRAAAVAAAKSGRLAPALAGKLVQWAPSTGAGLTEGLQAGAGAYDDAIRSGKSEQEALAAMAKVAAGTAATSIVALKKGVFSEGRKPGAKVAISAGLGGTQESFQTGLENVVAERPVTEGMVQAFVAGAIPEGAMGAVAGEHAAAPAPEPEAPAAPMGVPEEAPGVLERIGTAGEEASERLREKGITTGESLGAHNFADPDVVRDFAVSIAGDVARGTMNFRDWSSRMKAVYGKDATKPALEKIWTAAQEFGEEGAEPGWRPGMPLAEIDPARVRLPKTAANPKIEDVTRYLDIQTRNTLGTVPADAAPEVKLERLRTLAQQEMADQMQKPDSGADWYAEDTRVADDHLAQVFPELKENPSLNVFQKAISAVMSNNSTPMQEAYSGAQIYGHFRDNQRIPLLQPSGKRWPAQGAHDQLVKLQEMVDALGVDGTVDFLTAPKTVAEVKRFRPAAEGKANDIVPGSMVLGPKIGRYFLDLLGQEHEGSAVDKWDSRGQYRRLGRLTNESGLPTEAPSPESERPLFMQLHADLAREHGMKRPSAAQSVLWHYEQDLYRRLGLEVKSTTRSQGTAKFIAERGIQYGKPEQREAGTAERTAIAGNAPLPRTDEGAAAGRAVALRGTGEAGGAGAGAVSAHPAVAVKRGIPGARRQRSPAQAGVFSRQPIPESPKFEFLPEHAEVQERIEAAAKPPDQESTVSRIRQAVGDIGRSFARTYEKLPRKQYHPLIYQLKQAEKGAGIGSQTAEENVSRITAGLDNNQYDLLRYKVLFDDLQETYDRWKDKGELPDGADDTFQLAFGVTPESLAQERPRIQAAVDADPKLQAALAERQRLWDATRSEYADAMQAAGHDVSDIIDRDRYFRHRVLTHIVDQQATAKLGGKPRVPSGRSSLKKRGAEAAKLDYSSDYITSEYEVMAQMIADTHKARFISWLKDPANKLNITEQVKAEAKRQSKATGKEVDWRKLIPATHEEWQPGKKNVFYSAQTVPERIVQELMSRTGEEIGITKDDLRTVLAMGGKRDGFTIPKEVAETLEGLGGREQHVAEKAAQTIQNKWKQYQLVSPPRVLKYNIRNLSGDAEITMTGNPNAFKKLKPAIKDLTKYYSSLRHGMPEMSPDMRSWFEHGGFQSTLQVQELSDLQSIDRLNRLLKKQGHQPKGVPGARLKTAPERLLKGWFNTAQVATNAREATLRYANYLEYLDQIRKGKGSPDNYGASVPEEVDALQTPEDKAYKLSNDLLGAYDEVSAGGQWTRKHAIPFWSFQEINFRRTKQLIKNAGRDQKLAGLVGRKLLGKAVMRSPYLAMRAGSLAIKGAFMMSLLKVWNQQKFPEEEKDLREDIRARPHIVLGRHADGSVRYFSRLGNVPDLLEWLDPEDGAEYFRDVLNGDMTPGQALLKWVEAGPVEKTIGQMQPLPRLGLEMAARQSFYPSITSPRPIYDRTEFLANHFGLADVYRNLTGKPRPQQGWGRAAMNVLTYEADPGLSASYDIMDKKDDWMSKHGLGSGGGGRGRDTLKSDGLRNMRLALRYRDQKAFSKYIAQYVSEGGTPDGMKQALKNLHPLHGLKKAERQEFEESLSEEYRTKLEQAIQFWEDTYGDPTKVKEFVAESREAIAEAKEKKLEAKEKKAAAAGQ